MKVNGEFYAGIDAPVTFCQRVQILKISYIRDSVRRKKL